MQALAYLIALDLSHTHTYSLVYTHTNAFLVKADAKRAMSSQGPGVSLSLLHTLININWPGVEVCYLSSSPLFPIRSHATSHIVHRSSVLCLPSLPENHPSLHASTVLFFILYSYDPVIGLSTLFSWPHQSLESKCCSYSEKVRIKRRNGSSNQRWV